MKLSRNCFASVLFVSLVVGSARGQCSEWKGGFEQPGTTSDVDALATFDDGSGIALYAGGFFQSAGGQSTAHVARWDGAQWSQLGGGVSGEVRALQSFDDGTGSALYVGGVFATAGGVAAA